ncbi:hypothetical protein EDD18DRAFT_1310625 [Armillaria luteobubalina]|uniref:CxC2-like cysteine cluster KDZ transposase-associated domain-containing protein n=1 Tax=Armillaria luteobubalina TaxID=153913 RepID=A0AA39Q093_9AGAR|nr:hypothetical protein EDD18DRAFT_1310625 [Armillaria luteobubalina]
MELYDEADGSQTVPTTAHPSAPSAPVFHVHTDYYSQSMPKPSTCRTGQSSHTTVTALSTELHPNGSGASTDPPTSMCSDQSQSTILDDFITSKVSEMSFLDPDYVAPAEVVTGGEKSMHRPRPLGDHPLLVWKLAREVFLTEMLQLEALPSDAPKNCATCSLDLGRFRCLSCMDAQMLCKTCIVDMHQAMPLHKIEEWTGSYFTKITLGALGLVIQLGHQLGDTCSLPTVVKSFVIIDVDGIFMVQMGFCDCMQATERHRQLLQSCLWPATTIYPQTAATFRILHLFQVLSFMSKISIYEFYHTLARLADNMGMHPPPPGGIEATQPGELALRCPACPHPRINLPDGWANNTKNPWIYRLFLAIDANFRLHHLNVSSEESDPSLNHGYAYFVEEKKFRSHLETYGAVIPIEEKSTCNNHDAVKLVNSQGGQGAAATGVGTVVCGRHDMKRPLSVGDLQKGERYINMDYFALSTLTCDTPPWLVISYNIACQWHKNFFSRIGQYPYELRPHQSERNILYLVPKFHLPTHILPCRNNFSFNYSAKVGRTDGEAPERGWAATNALANSTKEMGPGSRRDTLDDHFGDYNWQKIIIMAQTICQRYKDAFSAHAQHVVKFISFEDALRQEHSTAIDEWRKIVLLWESDHSQVNPFAPLLCSVTENAVHLELAQEEKEETSIEICHDVSPSEFIAQGLQLEEAQVRLTDDIKELGTHLTDLQWMRVQQQANRILRKTEAWIEVQKVYMPKTSLLRAKDDDQCPPGTEIHATKIPLYLPSAALRLGATDPAAQTSVIKDECRLRLAQAHDTLATLREHLLLKSYLVIWRQRFSQGQRYGTKANTLMHRVEMKIRADAACRHEWKNGLSPLKAEDVRGLDDYNESLSEGQRTLSWIWKTQLQGGKEGLQEGEIVSSLHIEWCKSRARAQRWQEECVLLTEEMCRVQTTFQYYVGLWKDRGKNVGLPGARAYALKQEALWNELNANAHEQWNSLKEMLPSASPEALDSEIDLDSLPHYSS